MQTRKDLLQAHRLMTQRAGLALLQGEADTAEQPLRRINMATFAGLMIAALVVAVSWIVGVFTHSGAQLQPNASGTVIMDKETGTPYIWCDGRLCPALNFASALLALGTANPQVRAVSQGSLAQFPRGQTIGISGLPALPKNLVKGPWSVCVQMASNATGQQHSMVTLVVGQPAGGQPVRDSQALLVRAQNQTWVIWNDQRMLIAERYVLGTGLGGQPAVDVPAAWLDSVDQGPAFAPPPIPGLRQPTGQGPNGHAVIGQVYRVQGVNGTQWYVQLNDGVAPISPTQAALLQVEAGQATPLSLQAVTQHPSAQQVQDGGLPRQLPAPVPFTLATPLCAIYNGAGEPGLVTVNGTIPAGSLPAAGSTGLSGVWLPPGAGALAGVTTVRGQQATSTYFLVTGANRYGLAAPAVSADLGYTLNTQRTLVPANILDLIPEGPALDPGKARLTVPDG